jgi:hypothetical protein
MSKDLIGALLETLGALGTMLGRVFKMRDEAAALRILSGIAKYGRRVNSHAIAVEAARSVPRPERDDS